MYKWSYLYEIIYNDYIFTDSHERIVSYIKSVCQSLSDNFTQPYMIFTLFLQNKIRFKEYQQPF